MYSNNSKIVSIITITTLIIPMASYMVIPYLALLLSTYLHLSIVYVGVVLGIGNFLQFAISIFGARWKKLCGVYYALILALFIRLVGFILIGEFNLILSILGVFISSIGASLYLPIAKSVIIDYSSSDKSQYNLSIFNSALNIGMLLGPCLGSIMIYYKADHEMLILTNIIFVLLILINLCFLKDIRISGVTRLEKLEKFTLDNEIKNILLIQCVFVIVFVAYQNFAGLYFSKINPFLYIVAAVVNSVFGIAQVIFVKKINNTNLRKIFYISFIFLSIGFLMFSLISNNRMAYLIMFCAASFIAIAEVGLLLKIDLVLSKNYKNNITYLFGISRLVSGVGFLIGNIISGGVYNFFKNSIYHYWIVMSILTIISFILLYLFNRFQRISM